MSKSRAFTHRMKLILVGSFFGAMWGQMHGEPAIIVTAALAALFSLIMWAFRASGPNV